ncbi:4Fe-4S dicluster domain-containing protein [Dethiobacter alkaliphilus]|uniref:4Fe-4S dicluster domain-containing protein n=1 Tax=Dethiobacter alkaliphilus TaxID=427926 RepID=UPI00222783E5|nr:4Fe-4S dicluster domain-containing protein [Dethiobacter alkaliphilus]MCW3490336.1 4Fe-4S dicluster domain-containing protein [Dethiobacter alkaliphilus]
MDRQKGNVVTGPVRMPAAAMGDFVDSMIKQFPVVAPVAKGKEFVFRNVASGGELAEEYQPTILPPKKILQQPVETIFSFEKQQVQESKGQCTSLQGEKICFTDDSADKGKKVLFGVRPCDVHSFFVLDEVFCGEMSDPIYCETRQNTLIVAENCVTPCRSGFCYYLQTGPGLSRGYDLLLTKLDDQYLIEVGSDDGAELLSDMGMLSEAPGYMLDEKEERLGTASRRLPKHILTRNLDELLEANTEHPVWEELRQRCLGCGTCTMVCPTCFCYNVYDKLDLNLSSGVRQREWDSCKLMEFSQVALGHNFRKDREARAQWRIYHKLLYQQQQFNKTGCVGCGRCIHSCVVDIDLTDVAATLGGE